MDPDEQRLRRAQAERAALEQRERAAEFVAAARRLVDRLENPHARELAEADLDVIEREMSRAAPRMALLRLVAVELRADLVAAAGVGDAAELLEVQWS